jgi:hypothetical protein
MINRKAALAISIALALLAVGGLGAALAQGGGDPVKILRWTWAASTGGTMTSTSYSLAGTTGQADTGLSVGPEGYIVGGIWTPHYISPVPPEFDIEEPPPFDEPEELDEGEAPGEGTGPVRGGEQYFPACGDLNWTQFPSLDDVEFPATLGLPDMPTVVAMGYITEVFDPIISLTASILQWDTVITSALLLPQGLSGATGIGIDGFQTGGSSDINTFTIAGYTAAELAGELVAGMDAALSYVRSVNSIGVIGPTAAAMVVGMAWIAFVAFAKIVTKGLMIVVHFVVEIWRLLPFT